MAIPDYQELMLPLLQMAADSSSHTVSEAIETLAGKYQLTDDDRREMLPSGTQRRFDNRIYWARTYLKQAGLLIFPQRGQFQVTDEGRAVLARKPTRIDVKYLEQFPKFVAFRKRKSQPSEKKAGKQPVEQGGNPEEVLEENHLILRSNLAADLLSQISSASPKFFEILVIDVLVAMGYGGSRKDAGAAVGGSGDGGIDGIIKEDRLGLDVIYVQAKRWGNTVGRPVVQAFAGSLEGFRAKKGILITTSGFSSEAKQYVKQIEKRIILIDGEELADLMIDNNVAVTPVAKYEVKKVDADYFVED